MNPNNDECACGHDDQSPACGGCGVPSTDEEMKRLQEDLKTYETGWKRALADYQNLQKDLQLERSRMAEWSQDQILEELIPVTDHFDEALFHAGNGGNGNAVFEGFKHIRREMEEVFSRHGVTTYGVVGDRFTASQYESVGSESGTSEQDGTVVKVVARGYKRGERVLRPARVVVFTQQDQ